MSDEANHWSCPDCSAGKHDDCSSCECGCNPTIARLRDELAAARALSAELEITLRQAEMFVEGPCHGMETIRDAMLDRVREVLDAATRSEE